MEERIQGYRDHDTSVVVDYNPDGRILEMRRAPIEGGGFVAVLTDVTERKNAEAELADKEA